MANQPRLAERLGLKVRRPPIRQSLAEDRDYCLPYFMWKHRFGLVRKRAGPGRALTIGSFFHELMDANVRGLSEAEALEGCAARILDVSDRLTADESPFVETRAAIDGMQKALSLARVMAEIAYKQYPLPPRYSVLHTEHQEHVRPSWMHNWPVQGTLDRLVSERVLTYDGKPTRYWVLDYKTTSKSPKLRAQTCMREWQTDIYWLLARETLRQAGLDPKALVGIIHWIIQVPGITLCQNDRDFEMESRVLKSGPRKGQTIETRKWSGEPKWSNYYKRVGEWYRGTGFHDDRVETVKTDPPIIQSFVRYGSDPFAPQWKRTEVRRLYLACTREPTLAAFPIRMSARKCSSYGACQYMPLCQADCSIHKEVIEAQFRVLPLKPTNTTTGDDDAVEPE